MKKQILPILLCIFTYICSLSAFADTPPIAQPIFLKLGFSSVIEFDEEPEKIIIGDNQSFQVEKTNKSLVIRSLTSYASSNLFVYFNKYPIQIFSLTADEDTNPTLLKKILLKPIDVPKQVNSKNEGSKKIIYKEGIKITKTEFSKSKDYLTFDLIITAGNHRKLEPTWKSIRLICDKKKIPSYKTWSEREEIQKDSSIKARLIYLRPDVQKNLKKCSINIPLKGSTKDLTIEVKI